MALTAEEIQQKFSNGTTVEIKAPEDYNMFVTYLNSNPTSSNMRNVLITSDLDFENKDITMYSDISADNITIDGGSHTLKNIVKTSISNEKIFFPGDISDNSIIKNITFSNCYIQSTGNMYLFFRGCLNNIKIEKCRFASSRSMYIAMQARNISYFSSSATFLPSDRYYGIDSNSGGDHIACVNNIIYTGSDSDERAVSVSLSGKGSFIYTRDKFKNFYIVKGIASESNNASCYTSYAAISSDDAAVIYPFGERSNQTSCYYDNTLVPNAANNTHLGVPTEVLQSTAEMTSRGWFVKAVE